MTDPTAPQVIVAGHVCLDLIPLFDPTAPAPALTPGTLVHVGPAMRSTGGAVSNTGIALHRLGVPVTLMGKVGDDLFGGEVMRLLGGHGRALTAGMAVAPGEVTSYSIVISPPGVDRTFLHCPGTNDTFGPDDMRWDHARGARLLHFGYPPIMRRLYADGGEAMAAIFAEARRRGMATSLDFCGIDPASDAGRVDWAAWLARVLPHVDVFLPSQDEILAALRQREDESSPEPTRLARVADELIRLGVAVVVLKMGEAGLLLRTTDNLDRLRAVGGGLFAANAERWVAREIASPCFDANVVGTTGSGDCTIAGFLAALLRGEGPEATAETACAVGACSVEAADATSGVPAWEKVDHRIAAGWPRRHAPVPTGWQEGPHGVRLGPHDATASSAAPQPS